MSLYKKFDMPYMPSVSINHCYGMRVIKGKPAKFMKKEPGKWKEALKRLVHQWASQEGVTITTGAQVEIFLDARFPKPTNGAYADADNFHKLAKDAITAGLGLKSDHQIKISDRSISHEGEGKSGRLIYEVVINNETKD